MLKRLSSRRIAAPLAALLLFPSCLAPRSSQEHSPAAVMLDIPPITQEDAYDCGLASIAMLGAHYDVEIPAEQREVLRRKASDQRGLSGNDVAAALVASGFEVHMIEGRLDRSSAGLTHQIDLGRPVLIHLRDDDGRYHAGLVTGYDPVTENVRLHDPALGACWLDRERFASRWEAAGRFALIAVPRDSITEDERVTLSVLAHDANDRLTQQVAGNLHLDENEEKLVLVLGVLVLVVVLL